MVHDDAFPAEKLPTSQIPHSVDLWASLYVPLSHRGHLFARLSCDENDPSGQSTQNEDPLSGWYVPAGHRLHEELPELAKDPGKQTVQELAPKPDENPALHG